MKRGVVLTVLVCFLFCLSVAGLWAQDTDEANLSMLQGYEAFRNGDWVSALFFLRKAVSYEEASEETWYLLILAEMHGEEYVAAVEDCQQYMNLFPDGNFYPFVEYQYGRALYCAGQYQDSISQFTDFCHTYPDSQFYPSAVFYIAESFFSEYNYASAKVLYQRLVDDYPNAERTPEAQERLRTIAQAEREEKLLYLLRVTGEEYLAAKEDYEKQLRKYQSEDSMGLQDQLSKSFSDMKEMKTTVDELQYQNAEQARRIAQLEEENKNLQIAAEEAIPITTDTTEPVMPPPVESSTDGDAPSDDTSGYGEVFQTEGPVGTVTRYPELEALRAKAQELQELIDEKGIGGGK